jgi:hypothetical protein
LEASLFWGDSLTRPVNCGNPWKSIFTRVGPETAMLPIGWEKRLIRLETPNTQGAIGWCLHPVDLAFSKLAARRSKDLDFVGAMLRLKLIGRSALVTLIDGVGDSNLRARLTEALALCQRR